jgi:hypothetical protein
MPPSQFLQGLQVFRNVDEEITFQSESICSKYVRQGLTLFCFVDSNSPFARIVCGTPQLRNRRPMSKTLGIAWIGQNDGGKHD